MRRSSALGRGSRLSCRVGRLRRWRDTLRLPLTDISRLETLGDFLPSRLVELPPHLGDIGWRQSRVEQCVEASPSRCDWLYQISSRYIGSSP
jgi:hypothetical protein